ncbi:MAG: recombinase family protein [Syntrophaceticus schinkii]
MRAAIYVRVSTEEQAVHGYSLAEQREACSQRAAELGAVEILLFADEGASGATLDRPGLDALREAVRMGTVNTLVLRDPDRLSRRLAHQLYLSEEFEKAGVQLEFLDFEWKTTPEGRLFYAIKGAIAEYEREKIRERVTRGKLQKPRGRGAYRLISMFMVTGMTRKPERYHFMMKKPRSYARCFSGSSVRISELQQ